MIRILDLRDGLTSHLVSLVLMKPIICWIMPLERAMSSIIQFGLLPFLRHFWTTWIFETSSSIHIAID